jgi:hypothetical protein
MLGERTDCHHLLPGLAGLQRVGQGCVASNAAKAAGKKGKKKKKRGKKRRKKKE